MTYNPHDCHSLLFFHNKKMTVHNIDIHCKNISSERHSKEKEFKRLLKEDYEMITGVSNYYSSCSAYSAGAKESNEISKNREISKSSPVEKTADIQMAQSDVNIENKDVSDYYSYLRENYGVVKNGDVTIAGEYLKQCSSDSKKADELEHFLKDIQNGRYASNVDISQQFLAKMADDPELAAEYMDEINNMKNSDGQCGKDQNAIGQNVIGGRVIARGWVIDKNGGVSSWSITVSGPKTKSSLQKMRERAEEIKLKKIKRELRKAKNELRRVKNQKKAITHKSV